MNERLLRLLYSTREIIRSIHQDIQAIYEKENSQSNQDRPPIKLDISSEIRLPVSVSEYYASEQNESQKGRRLDRIRLGLETAALIAAISAGIFTLLTLHQVQRQADAAQAQVSIMQQQLEATDRPWVKIDATANTDWKRGAMIGGPLSFDAEGHGSLTAKLTLTNTGRSVANHVYLRQKILATGLDAAEMDLPPYEQKTLCDGPNQYIKDKHKIDPRYTIFPNDTQVEFMASGFDTKQVRMLPSPIPFKNGKPIQLYLIGCVDYDYSLSTGPHQTGFIYEVYGDKMHQGIQTLMTIPVDQLTFEPYAFGGKYAY